MENVQETAQETAQEFTSLDLSILVVSIKEIGDKLTKSFKRFELGVWGLDNEEETRSRFENLREQWENLLGELETLGEEHPGIRCSFPGSRGNNAKQWHYLLSVPGHPITTIRSEMKKRSSAADRLDIKAIGR